MAENRYALWEEDMMPIESYHRVCSGHFPVRMGGLEIICLSYGPTPADTEVVYRPNTSGGSWVEDGKIGTLEEAYEAAKEALDENPD